MSQEAGGIATHPVRDALLTAASLVVVLAGARYASSLLVPFLLALFIAIILHRPIAYLQRKEVPHWLAMTLVCFLALGSLTLVLILLGASINSFVDAVPEYQAQLRELVGAWADWLVDRGIKLDRENISGVVDPSAAFGFLGGFLLHLGDTLSHLVLIILTVIFILAEASGFREKMSAGIPLSSGRHFHGLEELLESMTSYVTTKTLISLLTGLMASLGLWLLDVQFAVLWGFVAFLLNFLPNVGSVIAAIPPVVLSLLQRDPMLTGAIIFLYLMINMVIGNLIEPRVMGQRLGLSTLAVFLSLLFWGWMFGPVGMLLSVPLTMTLRFIAMTKPGSAWFAVAVSASPARPEPDPDAQ